MGILIEEHQETLMSNIQKLPLSQYKCESRTNCEIKYGVTVWTNAASAWESKIHFNARGLSSALETEIEEENFVMIEFNRNKNAIINFFQMFFPGFNFNWSIT